MTSAVLESWRLEPLLAAALLLTSIVYLRGWRLLRRQMPSRFGARQAVAFHAGLAAIYVALASPLDTFAGLLLQAHMAQHLLLMTAAPALLLLGAPAVPLLRGLPGAAVAGLGPFLAAPELRRLGTWLSRPAFCLVAMSAATWIWHLPGPYQLALRAPGWHEVEHATFLVAGLLFWWPVVQPWPSAARWPPWSLPLYLLAADVQNTALAAILVFSGRVLYPAYESVPRLGATTALDDQVTAGVLMWVPMSLAYLVPAAVITVRLLSPRPSVERGATRRSVFEPESGASRRTADLLRLRGLGPILRAAATRPALQAASLLVAAAIVADGLLGPQMSPMNLAGVLPWTYGRALAVAAVLAVGNLFCMTCPFTLPRALARRLGVSGRWSWPRRLRSKWPALALLLLFFWAYEVLALWDSPRWTAALILAYFAAAFAVDAAFRGASFCKYVCPIGQFQFVHSLLSPFDVRARDPSVCATCTTHDCLRGNDEHRGCDTGLLVPRKAGGLDCTLCLDCARACPHDNVALVAVVPGRELWRAPALTSSGRLAQRLDLAALALLLVSASLVTAALMVAPVVAWESALTRALGFGSPAPVVTLAVLVGMAAAPALLILGGAAGRRSSGVTAPVREVFCRLALALVPLGAAIWAAHFLFHLVGAWYSALPVGLRLIGSRRVEWALPPAPLGAESLLRLEVLLLDAGLLLALYAGWRVAASYTRTHRAALALLWPWMLLAVALYAGGVWVFLQPMEMRGTMSH